MAGDTKLRVIGLRQERNPPRRHLEDEVVEALRWHNDPVTESDRWNLASGDEFIREGSRDAKHRRRFADGHRQPI